jgi:hypothetical protein
MVSGRQCPRVLGVPAGLERRKHVKNPVHYLRRGKDFISTQIGYTGENVRIIFSDPDRAPNGPKSRLTPKPVQVKFYFTLPVIRLNGALRPRRWGLSAATFTERCGRWELRLRRLPRTSLCTTLALAVRLVIFRIGHFANNPQARGPGECHCVPSRDDCRCRPSLS